MKVLRHIFIEFENGSSNTGDPMVDPLGELVQCWIAWGGIDARFAPDPAALEAGFPGNCEPCRAGAPPRDITDWEERHGYRLPAGLRAWLKLSNGLFASGPLIHPISAIGPMIPFARMPDMIVQPESWFELGNPSDETICIDLAYRLPGGGYPIFTSGDDASHSRPRIIARSFEEWFLELIRNGGREYWFDQGFADFGDPWECHRRHVSHPSLSKRLGPFAERVAGLLRSGVDERRIALLLGLSSCDVESIFRHIQHVNPDAAASRAV
jgi:hypothetical protein